MRLEEFDYTLPSELIARYPLKERDAARLMVVERKTKEVKHRLFCELINHLDGGETLVLNDTKVLPCLFLARRRSGAKVKILLLGHKKEGTFSALIRPARVKLGEQLILDTDIQVYVSGRNEVTFSTTDQRRIYASGKMPIPPYLKRDPQPEDELNYQTVYARQEGSVAAPTAGLHFTPQLLERLTKKGVRIGYVTLHVGYTTFQSIRCQDITQHRLEKEYFVIPQETISLIEQARQEGRRVVAVGTTVCRALESYASYGMTDGWTQLFIYPGYQFKLVDSLITNFHLPRSSLFILVCAFAGRELMQHAYKIAIEQRYRFYSYGDAMFII